MFNNIKKILTDNEQNSSVAKRFIRKLKKKIYQYINSVSKNLHIDKLDNKLISTTLQILVQSK